MATSSIQVSSGSGTYIATNSISEDAVTKNIQRVAINNSSGTELATASNPLQVSLANTAANSTAVKVDGSTVTQPVSMAVPTSGGYSIYSGSIGATATSVKASAGQIYGWYIYNANTSAVYVQIFNVASGSVSLGSTAPTFSLGIPASGGANVSFPQGIAMGTAITVAVTTTRAGSTGPSSTVDLNIFYA